MTRLCSRPRAHWRTGSVVTSAIGVHELIFDSRGQSVVESIERLQRFATEVVPLVGG